MGLDSGLHFGTGGSCHSCDSCTAIQLSTNALIMANERRPRKPNADLRRPRFSSGYPGRLLGARKFALSNIRPPDSLYTDVPGKSFTLRNLDWRAAPYFSLMMMSRDLDVMECFRAPFLTSMGRDALVVDIPITNPKEAKHPTESIRLCTTHLESLWEGKVYRHGQLTMISALLKGTPTLRSRVVAGLVGGDMNAIDRPEHEFHRTKDVELRDAWEDLPAPPVPILKPFQKDLSYGRARGNTWGYQSNGKRERKRLDKFFYTGSMETVALSDVHDVTGKLG